MNAPSEGGRDAGQLYARANWRNIIMVERLGESPCGRRWRALTGFIVDGIKGVKSFFIGRLQNFDGGQGCKCIRPGGLS